MAQKIGCLIVDVQGLELTAEDKELLAHPLVGGVILFARNYKNRQQLQALCAAIRKSRAQPLLIMVDQEGGRVQRFVEDFTRLPPMGLFGRLYDDDPIYAREMSKETGWLLATELLAAGVDLSLAPVLDLNRRVSQIIGERAFHADGEVIIALATAFMQGMREAGMASIGKHFPGHGSVVLDSHLALPVDERPLAVIAKQDLIPFMGLIKAGINGLMAAHIVFSKVDHLPAGFSSWWLQKVLRSQMGFRGLIFSDDLNMEGANISANYADRVAAARDAGCDFVLLCNNRSAVIQVLDQLSYDKHLIDLEKWGVLQGRMLGSGASFRENPRWQKANQFLLNNTQKA